MTQHFELGVGRDDEGHWWVLARDSVTLEDIPALSEGPFATEDEADLALAELEVLLIEFCEARRATIH